jgi:hypothetical protein
MEPIDLSQGSGNLLVHNLDSVYPRNFLTKECWEGLLACKKIF